ncbi:hypothetical protein [Verrucosispora sp. NA02020]|uniref:hypothetical protein n=1 Tax=Verrucosispora sp. NA02020 TaxID=2742132 RepID=UPI001591E3AD|nr:hypothetical protein [Verrucosispora sp. NA02020]QKW15464.1 hypothetical protein HUT12_23630 [Verrucosispora sp. NA02020]
MTAPPAVVVYAVCPDCETPLPITVTAEPGGRADDGMLQVAVLSDKTEVEAHSLTCNGMTD